VGVPGGPSSGEPGTLVPVGGVQAPTPRGAEHQAIRLAGVPVAADVGVEYLGDQTWDRDGAAPGGCLGFGAVAAYLGGGFDHMKSVAGEVDSCHA
jgi:hypothetical protein